MDKLYTAEVLSTGAGRNGHVQSTDGLINMDLAIPKEMGGAGNAPNPELLFAAGYAACFHSAMGLIAGKEKADITDATVGARVSIGSNGQGGYGLAVELEVVIPHMDQAAAQALADKAHQVCPYSNAVRGNIEVTVTVSND